MQSFAFLQCFDLVRHQKGRPAYKNTKTILLAIRLVYHKHLLYSLFCFCVPTFPGHSSLCGPGGCQKITSVDRLTRFFYQMLVLSFSLKRQNILKREHGDCRYGNGLMLLCLLFFFLSNQSPLLNSARSAGQDADIQSVQEGRRWNSIGPSVSGAVLWSIRWGSYVEKRICGMHRCISAWLLYECTVYSYRGWTDDLVVVHFSVLVIKWICFCLAGQFFRIL